MFERILNAHLVSCGDLTAYLTKYNGRPAVFNKKAPSDNDTLWDDNVQYSRIVSYVNMQADIERKISGTLEMDIQSYNEADIPKIVEELIKSVDGFFFTGKSETVLVKWNATRYFTEPDKLVSVAAVICTLIAFPSQITQEPDPIRLVNEWTRTLIPDCKLIGYDKDVPEVWKPTDDIPAVYWRNSGIYPSEHMKSTYSGNWYTAHMHAHIFTDNNTSVSNALANLMCQELNQIKILKFDDGTWLRVDWNNQVKSGTDETRLGQLSVEGDYCILNVYSTKQLNKIIINQEESFR